MEFAAISASPFPVSYAWAFVSRAAGGRGKAPPGRWWKGFHIVATLRLLEAAAPSERHEGEVYSCAYTPDSAFVLSGGWDGVLRLWDASTGEARLGLSVSPKPLSCCASSPDGQQWLTGSMEGMLGFWDGVSHQMLQSFVAHTRPISAICFSPDGQGLATASWDRQVTLRKPGSEREARVLSAHLDIVSGCRFTIDGKHLISWSHDRSIKLWDVQTLRDVATLAGHTDRVTTLSLSPDGRYALSGGRDATARLWDLDAHTEAATVNLGAEVRSCCFLLDGESVVVADAVGRLFLMAAPSFEVLAQAQTPFKVMCGELAPSGTQLALGGEDGRVHFVAVEGLEGASFVVAATPNFKPQANLFERFLGKTRMTRTWTWFCPACRHSVESATLPTGPVACPQCRRPLRVHGRQLQEQR
jgi:WD40 repeat protein